MALSPSLPHKRLATEDAEAQTPTKHRRLDESESIHGTEKTNGNLEIEQTPPPPPQSPPPPPQSPPPPPPSPPPPPPLPENDNRYDDDDEEEEEEEEEIQESSNAVEGLYLDTINRANLDFDFEKICSVSLSNINIYACLICGKYFQGRGKQTHAYYHSINNDHRVFMNLKTLKVYVLPENYEVEDKSLNDIKSIVQPVYTAEKIAKLDTELVYSRDLDGKKYVPGCIGLNKIKCNDYMNVVLQALSHVPDIRDTFLMLPNLEDRTELVQRLAILFRRIWHSKLFKAHVSPHELVQEVVNRSKRRFKLDVQGDAFEFLTWLLNTLHIDLGGTRKRNSSVIYRSFQGEVQIDTQKPVNASVQEKDGNTGILDTSSTVEVAKRPFLTLSLELPNKPLFLDDDENHVNIPQVALVSLLRCYDGSTEVEWRGEIKRYRLQKLPKYIICHVKRFSHNNFSTEKNPTVVNYPIRNVSFGTLLPKDAQSKLKKGGTYDLIANICHDGETSSNSASFASDNRQDSYSGTQKQNLAGSAHITDNTVSTESQYIVYLYHPANDRWYKIRDLQAEPVMPQIMFLSDTYIQIWQHNESQ